MIYLRLFLTFLEIGALSFGSGYGMLPLIKEKTLELGWLSEEEFLDLCALSESTPGPLAVNAATFVGASEAGLLGALAATLGVVLPSFVIILLIAALMQNIIKHAAVKGMLSGVRPAVVGLLSATVLLIAVEVLFGMESSFDLSSAKFDLRAAAILGLLIVIRLIFGKLKGRTPSPILMIIVAAGLGIILF